GSQPFLCRCPITFLPIFFAILLQYNAWLQVGHRPQNQSSPVRPPSCNEATKVVPYAPWYHKPRSHHAGDIYPKLLLRYVPTFYGHDWTLHLIRTSQITPVCVQASYRL